MPSRKILTVFLLTAIPAGTLRAEEPVDYTRDIKPLLTVKCYACHGALRQESGLRLDAGSLILLGHDGDTVVERGNADESRLLQRITADDVDMRMPPEGEGEALNARQVALIRTWIDGGAVIPDDEPVPEDPRQHWAYQPVVRPEVPSAADPLWSHPIDAFIAAEHQRRHLEPVDVADRHTLLRRLHFDLIGLPPTRPQIHAFVTDQSAGAWTRVVDQLLETQQYGERWARHWMDVWRYSDWDGYKEELRGSQRHIWHWRDWIVHSLNADTGYDQMIVQMLAGDEIAPDDPTALAATGFLARNHHKSNRNMWLDATVEHTAKAFLGMTLNCARCHDHKYDPIAQQEYYQFRAIFEPHRVRMDRIPGQPDLSKNGLPRAFDADLTASTFLYVRGNEKQPDEDHPMTPAVPSAPGGEFTIEPIDLPTIASFPSLVEFAISEDLEQARHDVEAAEKQLAATRADAKATEEVTERHQLAHSVALLHVQTLEARIAADRAKSGLDEPAEQSTIEKLSRQAARRERDWKLRKAELQLLEHQAALVRVTSDDSKGPMDKATATAAVMKMIGEAQEVLKQAQEAHTKTDGEYTPLGTDYPRTSTGRRLALARWITSRQNPLTARVAVNHIWMRHFGEPLVENVDDFGLRSPRPDHAQLLDWLASELMDHNWSMKHLHQLILTSRTWQLSSSSASAKAENHDIDPDNRFFWRSGIRRLDAELVRDSLLAVSDELDSSLGGPTVAFADADDSTRRSLYIQHAYEKQAAMLVLFDAASPNECYRRSESIIPQQALALQNSPIALSQSRRLATQLSDELADVGADHFVEQAFLQVLSRPPLPEEREACVTFLQEQAGVLSDPLALTSFAATAEPKVAPASDPDRRARENLIHVLINHNDFITAR